MNEQMEMATSSMSEYGQMAMDLLMEHGPNVLLAIVVLLIGLRVVNAFTKMLKKLMEKRNVDETLRPFLSNLLNWTLKALLVVSVAGMVGIETTSFVAILGAAGLAIGLALQGTLANFAGGVLLLIFKPFKVGDLIEAGGHLGVVEEIQIFVTILKTLQNRVIIIPNGILSNGSLTNYSAEDTLRVDMVFGIAYNADLKKAKEIFNDILDKDGRVLAEPARTVAVSELADNSVNFVVRPWVKTEDYWDVYFNIHEQVKLRLDEAGIGIPFPQRDVHVYNHDASDK
jgi:small conductance mechanosensitive channel